MPRPRSASASRGSSDEGKETKTGGRAGNWRSVVMHGPVDGDVKRSSRISPSIAPTLSRSSPETEPAPTGVGRPYSLRARRATTPTSWYTSTGFGMWNWKPARRTRALAPVSPVRAAASVCPPRSGGSARTLLISEWPSWPGMARSLTSTFGSSRCIESSASGTKPTAVTLAPYSSSTVTSRSRMSGASSTTSTPTPSRRRMSRLRESLPIVRGLYCCPGLHHGLHNLDDLPGAVGLSAGPASERLRVPHEPEEVPVLLVRASQVVDDHIGVVLIDERDRIEGAARDVRQSRRHV